MRDWLSAGRAERSKSNHPLFKFSLAKRSHTYTDWHYRKGGGRVVERAEAANLTQDRRQQERGRGEEEAAFVLR